ncbi:MAG: hypothetical protein R6W82_07155 [bacterium]
MEHQTARCILVSAAAAALMTAGGGCVRPVMLSGSETLEMSLPLGSELVYVREVPTAGWTPGDTLVHRIVEFVPGDRRQLKLDRVWIGPYAPGHQEGIPDRTGPRTGAGRTRADGPIIRIEARMGRLAPRYIYRANTPAGMVRLSRATDRAGDLLAPAPGTGVYRWGAGSRKMRVAAADTLVETPAGDFRCIEVVYEDPAGQHIRSWWADRVGWVGTRAVAYRPGGQDPYGPWFLTGESWVLVEIRRPR